MIGAMVRSARLVHHGQTQALNTAMDMAYASDELAGIRKLHRFTRWLLEGGQPDDLLPRLVEATREIVDADDVVLFRLDEDCDGGGQLVARSGRLGEVVDDSSATLMRAVLREEEPVLFNDVSDDPRFEEANSIEILAITSAVGAPLKVEGEWCGVLVAVRQRLARNFREVHRQLMEVAAGQAELLMTREAGMRALRDSEARYRSLVEMSPSAIAVIQQGELVFANQTACGLWGVDEVEKLQGSRVEELFSESRSVDLMEALRRGESFESIDAWAREDGGLDRAVEVVGRPAKFEGKWAMQLIVSTVGEKREVMARRVRTDRLVMMGTMAATVGHEINNPLSYVCANLEYALEELEHWWRGATVRQPDGHTRSDIIDGLASACEGTERIRAVVDGIQNFHRLDDDAQRPASIEQPLRSSLQIARTKLDPDVEVQVDIRPTAPVGVSAARLGQVFLNLLINGAQALSEVDGEEKRLEVRTRQEEGEVIVEIADTGPGLDEELKSDIFQPFVSTKGTEGTGLGLAICRDIVTQARGAIDVETERRQGCLFRVRLPEVEEQQTQSFEVLEDESSGLRGTVLIVDPEPTLAKSLQRILQRDHEVMAVTTKGDALELLATEEFDVILCDLRMRGGLGRDLFRWVQEQAPEYWDRMVAMTASRLTPKVRQELEALPNRWVAKPFDMRRLRGIIDRLLVARREEMSAVGD